MTHNLELHMKTLDNLCRTCGKRALSFKQKMNKKHKIRLVDKYTHPINEYFGIDTSSDSVTIHPDKLCTYCYNSMMTQKRNPNSVIHEVNRATALELNETWVQYKFDNSPENCRPCLQFIGQMKGGRSKSLTTKEQLPFDVNLDDLFYYVQSNVPIMDTTNFYLPGKIRSQKENDHCQVCKNIFALRTVYLPECEHMFCSQCISGLFKVKQTTNVPCPTCRTQANFTNITRPNLQITTRLRELVVACHKCNHCDSLESMATHKCVPHQGPAPTLNRLLATPPAPLIQLPAPPCDVQPIAAYPADNTPAGDRIKDILNKPINTPLSRTEEQVLTNIFKRKLHQSQSGIVQLRTGGQSIPVQRLVKARKRSSQTHSPLKKKRARILDKGRKILAGEECTSDQLSSELKRIPIKKRVTICARAGIKRGAHISKHLALAIKCYTGISWNQRRRLQRILKTIGITQENETAQRKEKDSLLNDHLDAKSINFEFKDENDTSNVMGIVVKPAPYVFVRNIKDFLFEHITRCKANNLLHWHQESLKGSLPIDKIIVKVGGDKGRGSMKLCMQICNMHASNSPDNTLIIGAFEASDTYANLAIALDGIAQQLDELDGVYWDDGYYRKQIHVIGSGDYDFLAKILGIAGASGTYPCIYCKIHRNDMQLPPTERRPTEKRSIDNLNSDYLKYASDGKLQSKKQAQYYNVINPAILNLEPEKYSIPYLHCLLGIVKKQHEMQEISCHSLDVEIAIAESSEVNKFENTSYRNFVHDRRRLTRLETKYHNLEERMQEIASDADDLALAQIVRNNNQKQRLTNKMTRLAQKIDALKVDINLTPGSGPIVQHIETILQKHNIQRQKYHGKSFVGNDCHKYLSTWVYTDICENIVTKTIQLTDDPTVIQHARTIAQKFRKLWQLFAAIHNKISHAKLIEDDNIPLIHQSIVQYFQYFRREFPSVRITTKQHLLEDHAMDWIIQYQFGFGLFGEQGMESIHHKIRRLADNHHGIINPLQRLKATIQEHHLHTCPEMKSQLPAIKERN